MITHWPNGVGIYVNMKDAPSSLEDIERVINYLCWSIQQRTAINVYYAGITNSEKIEGAIVLRWGGLAEYQEYGLTWEQYAAGLGFAANWGSPYTSSVIVINASNCKNPLTRSNIRSIMHETLHCLGLGHSGSEHSIMTSNASWLSKDTYGLTCEDMINLDRGGNHTFVELTLESDLYIPCVEGQTVQLLYCGDGDIHRWKLGKIREAGPVIIPSNIESINMSHPSLVINDVRSPDMNLTNVQLNYGLETYEWTLHYADFV